MLAYICQAVYLYIVVVLQIYADLYTVIDLLKKGTYSIFEDWLTIEPTGDWIYFNDVWTKS